MRNIFNEVMLNKINFIESKNDIKFEFYNAVTGKDIGKIICKNIFIFNFNTTFIVNQESFPCFVLDVTVEKLINNNIELTFNKMNYKYFNNNDLAIPNSNEYYLLKIEGGPMDISVICCNIEVNKI